MRDIQTRTQEGPNKEANQIQEGILVLERQNK